MGEQASGFFDAGNLAEDRVTAGVILDTDVALGCRFILFGSQEMAWGAEFLSALQERKLTGVHALTSLGKGSEVLRPYVIVSLGGKQAAMTSVAHVPAGEPAWSQLGASLREAKSKADELIVFSYLLASDRDRLVKEFGECIDLLMDAEGAGQPLSVGRTRIIPCRDKQNSVGILRTEQDRLEIEFRAISDKGPEDPEVYTLASNYFVQRQGTVQTPTITEGSQLSNLDVGYSRADTCGSCHSRQTQQWQTTRHVRALQTLRDKGNVGTECLSCHSELYRRAKRVQTEPFRFEGVECASCHGEGVLHALMPRQKGMDIKKTPEEATCRSCHDAKNNPDFDFMTAVQKVRH